MGLSDASVTHINNMIRVGGFIAYKITIVEIMGRLWG